MSQRIKGKIMKNLKYKSVKKVTLPLVKFAVGVPVAVEFLSEIFEGKEIKGTRDGATMDPADLANVINLETGEEAQIIVATVLKGILDDNYPKGAYVKKQFLLTKGEKQKGKRYFPYIVEEIQVAKAK